MIAEGDELDGVRLFSKKHANTFKRPRIVMLENDLNFGCPKPLGSLGFLVGGEKGLSDPVVGDHRDIIYSDGIQEGSFRLIFGIG